MYPQMSNPHQSLPKKRIKRSSEPSKDEGKALKGRDCCRSSWCKHRAGQKFVKQKEVKIFLPVFVTLSRPLIILKFPLLTLKAM